MPRKKVRGVRRRLREVERYTEQKSRLDLDHLERWGEAAAVPLLNPWFRENRPTPAFVARAIVDSVLRIHDAWLAQLRARGEPFHLAVWLQDPVWESRVVAAVGGMRQEYDAREWAVDRHVPRRPPLHLASAEILDRFDWIGHELVLSDRLSAFGPADQAEILRISHLRVPLPDGDVRVHWRAYRKWIGRLRPGEEPRGRGGLTLLR